MNLSSTSRANVAGEPDPATMPRKSQRKREMLALQLLGERLVGVSESQLGRIALPDELRAAILAAKGIKAHEAKRRQMQYIGRLMRHADAAPIRAALDAMAGHDAAETGRLHRLERLRARLLEDEGVITEIAQRWGDADVQRLRQLRRNALRESAQGRPPRAFRELFHVLRHLTADPTATDVPGAADGAGEAARSARKADEHGAGW